MWRRKKLSRKEEMIMLDIKNNNYGRKKNRLWNTNKKNTEKIKQEENFG